MLKILFFSGNHQFSPKALGIKFHYDRAGKPFHLSLGRHNLAQGRYFQQNYRPGKPRATSHRETLKGCKNAIETSEFR